jgi:hypothetical protein
VWRCIDHRKGAPPALQIRQQIGQK